MALIVCIEPKRYLTYTVKFIIELNNRILKVLPSTLKHILCYITFDYSTFYTFLIYSTYQSLKMKINITIFALKDMLHLLSR